MFSTEIHFVEWQSFKIFKWTKLPKVANGKCEVINATWVQKFKGTFRSELFPLSIIIQLVSDFVLGWLLKLLAFHPQNMSITVETFKTRPYLFFTQKFWTKMEEFNLSRQTFIQYNLPYRDALAFELYTASIWNFILAVYTGMIYIILEEKR